MFMDELDKKSQKGLESFSRKGDINTVKADLDGMIDDLFGEDDENSNRKGKGILPKWIYIGLVAIVLALIGYMGFKDGSKKNEKIDAPVLYAQYFEVLPDAISASERSVGEESEIESDVDAAMKAYNNGDYQRAASILKMQDEPGALVFGAIAEMKNEKQLSAINLLLKSQKLDTKDIYKDIIDWYLSLAYLKNGDIAKAKVILSAISSGKHFKKEQAKTILKSLKD